jgi:hypothetical protein
MEEVDGLFSSPEKSPVELNGFEDVENDSSVGSEGMSIDEGGLILWLELTTRCVLIQILQAMRQILWTSSRAQMARVPLFSPRPPRGRR